MPKETEERIMPLKRIWEAFLKTMKFSLGQACKTELLEINPGLGMWEGFGGSQGTKSWVERERSVGKYRAT